MIKVLVPTFDEFNKYSFIEHKTVEIKDKPDSEDQDKISKLLPGIPQGYISEGLWKELIEKKQLSIMHFYDERQNRKRFKNYYLTIL